MKPYHLPSLQAFFESKGIIIPDEKRGDVFLVFVSDSSNPLHVGKLSTPSWKVYKDRSEMARENGDEFSIHNGDLFCPESFGAAMDSAIALKPAVIHIIRDGLTGEELADWAKEVPALMSYVADGGQVVLGTENVSALLSGGNNEAPKDVPGASSDFRLAD